MNRIPKLFDIVKINKTGNKAAIIEIDDENGIKPPIYLVEIVDDEKSKNAKLSDVIFWCDSDDFSLL